MKCADTGKTLLQSLKLEDINSEKEVIRGNLARVQTDRRELDGMLREMLAKIKVMYKEAIKEQKALMGHRISDPQESRQT